MIPVKTITTASSDLNDKEPVVLQLLSSSESWGGYTAFQVYAKLDTDFNDLDDTLKNQIRCKCNMLWSEIKALVIAASPEKQKEKAKELRIIKELFRGFQGILSFTEIPNQYDGCLHEPWYEVLTTAGFITIGWRKRVINIDWSRLIVKPAKVQELLKDEDTTMGEHFIHAWSAEQARRYIEVLLDTAGLRRSL